MRLVFNIYRDGNGFALSQGDTSGRFATEADAIDMAVRIAQDQDLLYAIHYWRP